MVIALMLVLSACSTGTVSDNAENRYGEFPLESLVSETSVFTSLLTLKEEPYIGECMRRKGFKYFERRPDPAIDLTMIERPELTVDRAQRLGYSLPEPDFNLVDIDPESELAKYLDSLGEQGRREWSEALGGSEENLVSIELSFGRLSAPSEGCIAGASAQIAGDVETELEWDASASEIEALHGDAIHRTEADGDVQRAYDEWRQCMHNEGYQVDTIDDAYSLATEVPPTEDGDASSTEPPADTADEDATPDGPASPWEIKIAVADATCRDTSGYRTIYAERLSIYENEVLADNEQVLLDWEETRDQLKDLLADLITEYDLPDASGPGE